MKFGITLVSLLAACATSVVATPAKTLTMREVSAEELQSLKQMLARSAMGLSPRSPLEESNPCDGGYLDVNSCDNACSACGCTKGCEGFCTYSGEYEPCTESYECQCAG